MVSIKKFEELQPIGHTCKTKQNESRPIDLAYLEDRVLMRQGKKQLYGTQITINQSTGVQEVWPIEDEANLNSRRTSLGMEPRPQSPHSNKYHHPMLV